MWARWAYPTIVQQPEFKMFRNTIDNPLSPCFQVQLFPIPSSLREYIANLVNLMQETNFLTPSTDQEIIYWAGMWISQNSPKG